jgi:ABC-type antimicrobial peptide transport system permease subunit
MDLLVGIMLAFALVMAAALLFNAMSANIAERTVELGTLRAAGLSSGILARLAAAENLLLTGLGIPLGLVAGTMLSRWFMATYTTEGYRWALRMQPTTLLLVTVGILGASIVSQLPVLRTMRHLDITRIVRERSL